MSRQPSYNPAYSGSQTTRAAPVSHNQQAFSGYAGSQTTRAAPQAPVQWNAVEDLPKPKLETVLCGSCGTKNGVPPGAPSFNCYKCGRTSTRPGLSKEAPPKQYVAKPVQKKVTAKPVQQVSSGSTPNVVVVQQPQTQVVTTSTAGNQLAYGAYGGRSSSSAAAGAAAGFIGGALLGAALTGPRYGYGGYGCYGGFGYGGYRRGWGCRRGYW
jgi:ribosomal protein L37AE/L43A